MRPYQLGTAPPCTSAASYVSAILGRLKLLSVKLEGQDAQAWDPDRLDREFVARQVRAIVGFELRAEAVYALAKLSQNRTDADRVRVAKKLIASPDQIERATGEAVRAAIAKAGRTR
jgi:predicted FMN-binding regulatory protein PaiB